MKNKLKILYLLALSSVAASSELDNLLNTSTAIVNQIDTGITLVGAAQGYAHHGDVFKLHNLINEISYYWLDCHAADTELMLWRCR